MGYKSGDLRRTVAYFFGEQIFFHKGYIGQFLSERNDIWSRYWSGCGHAIKTYSRISWLWCGGPAIPCANMHQFFADALLKWFFDNVLVLADSFSVLSIHCVAWGLGASFLYKFPALCSGSLRQHGFCVMYVCSHLMGMFYRTIRMIENGIKPVYVFDGKPPDMKSGEVCKTLLVLFTVNICKWKCFLLLLCNLC